MAFKGKEPIRTKIVLDNQTLEQISDCRYLGSDVSFFKNEVSDNKLQKFQHICRSLSRILKKQSPKSNQT